MIRSKESYLLPLDLVSDRDEGGLVFERVLVRKEVKKDEDVEDVLW